MRSFILDGIYGYAGICTIGLFLGCLWYAWQTLRRPKQAPWFDLGRQLTVQRTLFGDWLDNTRLALAPWLFIVAAAIYQFEIFFLNSLYRYRLPWLYQYGAIFLDHVILVCLLLKVLFCTRYDGRQLAVAFAAMFIIRWVFVNNHQAWMMYAFWFALAAKDIELRRPLKVSFAIGLGSVGVVSISSFIGVIDTLEEVGTGRYRNSFGYGWYNYFGACILGLALMYVCLRGIKRLKWFDFVLLAALALLCDLGPDSRAATLCLKLLFVLLLIVRLWPAVLRPLAVRLILSAVPLVAFAVSMALALSWDPNNPILVKLDGLFSTRISLGWKGLMTMPFAIAGQMPGPDMLVDNAYLHYWILAGPVASAMIWCGFALLMWRLLKAGHSAEAICCLVMLCHATMETHVMWACVNVTIWLMCGVIFWPAQQPGFAPVEEKAKFHSKGVVKV